MIIARSKRVKVKQQTRVLHLSEKERDKVIIFLIVFMIINACVARGNSIIIHDAVRVSSKGCKSAKKLTSFKTCLLHRHPSPLPNTDSKSSNRLKKP